MDGNNDNFFLIRHGETYANRLNYIQGTLNDKLTSLTKRGMQEAANYQKLFDNNQIDYVYTSPLMQSSKNGANNLWLRLILSCRLMNV